jgi:hypothetical protein
MRHNREVLDHPVIRHMERDGYLPKQYYCPDEEPDTDEDWEYESRREAAMYGEG